MSILSDKVANPQYDALTSAELSVLLNDASGPESTAIVNSYRANALDIMSLIGIADGVTFLDALEELAVTVSAVKWQMPFLKSVTGVDVGDAQVRAFFDQQVSQGVFAATSIEAIKGLAESVQSWADFNGVVVRPGDIDKARAV